MYLIDTMVLSELRKPQRDTGLVGWFEAQRTADLFVSVISIGEVERGIARQRATDPGFAAVLAMWLDKVLALYSERILPFELQTARRWGLLSAALGNEGLGNESADLMIAATALEHGLTVVTRNVSDFEPTGVPVLDPFKPRRQAQPRRTE
jgi:predicted nucleic acid-binding protein